LLCRNLLQHITELCIITAMPLPVRIVATNYYQNCPDSSIASKISRGCTKATSYAVLCVCTEINCCHQSCSFWLRYALNRLSTGASPQTPLGELTALPRPRSWFRGWAPPRKGKEVREGEKERGEMRGGEGRERKGRGGSPEMPKSRVGKPSSVSWLVWLSFQYFPSDWLERLLRGCRYLVLSCTIIGRPPHGVSC